MTVTSIVWVFIIHWLACSELREDANIANKMLKLDIFKSLSKFSLHVYLSHTVTAVWLEEILRFFNIMDWFSKDFHVVFAYCTSYACSVHIQPRLDALVASTNDDMNQQPKENTAL